MVFFFVGTKKVSPSRPRRGPPAVSAVPLPFPGDAPSRPSVQRVSGAAGPNTLSISVGVNFGTSSEHRRALTLPRPPSGSKGPDGPVIRTPDSCPQYSRSWKRPGEGGELGGIFPKGSRWSATKWKFPNFIHDPDNHLGGATSPPGGG